MTDNERTRRHLHLPHLPHRSAPAAGRSATEPGWYDDPTGRFEQRYWDGEEWTTEVLQLNLKQFDLDDIDLRIRASPPAIG